MVASITAALVALMLVGLFFSVTRGLAVGAMAILVFMFPWLLLAILIGVAAAFFLFHVKSK